MVVPLACTHLFLILIVERQCPCCLRELCFPTETHGNRTQRAMCPCVQTFTAADLATEFKPQRNLRMTFGTLYGGVCMGVGRVVEGSW